jgi:RNA polymerase sigma factor (TIGR02999 family)
MDAARVDHLIQQIYAELKRQAGRASLRGAADASPTSVVHDTILRLYRRDPTAWVDEQHFRATAALALQQVLVDNVRRGRAARRSPDGERVSLADVGAAASQHDALIVGEVLAALQVDSPRTAQVVALKVLGGLENEEIAAALQISRATVDREWRAARALIATWGQEGR